MKLLSNFKNLGNAYKTHKRKLKAFNTIISTDIRISYESV